MSRETVSKIWEFVRSKWKATSVPDRVITIAALLAFLCAILWIWDWLATIPDGSDESRSTTLRNFGLLVITFIALPLAIWRSIVAQHQTKIAEAGLRNERYQKDAEMLGSKVLSVRLGGIYALQQLAEEDPEQHHVQVIRLLCAFVRNPVKYKIEEGHDLLREDIQIAMEAIGARSDADIKLETLELEKKGQFPPYAGSAYVYLNSASLNYGNFSRGNLSNANLNFADLSPAVLVKTSLSGTWLLQANLEEVILEEADLSNAILSAANLYGANLKGANISGTKFAADEQCIPPMDPAEGLTQTQLNEAVADPKNPPNLQGVYDSETHKPLVWNGKPLDE